MTAAAVRLTSRESLPPCRIGFPRHISSKFMVDYDISPRRDESTHRPSGGCLRGKTANRRRDVVLVFLAMVASSRTPALKSSCLPLVVLVDIPIGGSSRDPLFRYRHVRRLKWTKLTKQEQTGQPTVGATASLIYTLLSPW